MNLSVLGCTYRRTRQENFLRFPFGSVEPIGYCIWVVRPGAAVATACCPPPWSTIPLSSLPYCRWSSRNRNHEPQSLRSPLATSSSRPSWMETLRHYSENCSSSDLVPGCPRRRRWLDRLPPPTSCSSRTRCRRRRCCPASWSGCLCSSSYRSAMWMSYDQIWYSQDRRSGCYCKIDDQRASSSGRSVMT